MTERAVTLAPTPGRAGPGHQVAGRLLLGLAVTVLLAVSLPVLVQGVPLHDDYHFCARGLQEGAFGQYLGEAWADTGVVRPARFLTMLWVSELCQAAPFGLAMLLPLLLKLTVGWLLYRLLQDLRLSEPWPAAGAALWLVEPMGLEAALWPSALHVPLGLALALIALRAVRRGRYGWAAPAALGACLCIEQVIFALPVAAGLVAPAPQRRRALAVIGAVCLTVLVVYALFPGENPRQALSLAERMQAAAAKGGWLVLFPAAGLGAHSISMALRWLPLVWLTVVAAAALAGIRVGPRLLPGGAGLARSALARWGLAAVALVVLVNLPLIVTEVGYSGRTFTPTWLALAALAAAAADWISWRRPRLAGGLGGAYVGMLVMALALSSWTRVQTADFDRTSARWIAEQTADGDVVAICDVPRAALAHAPLGGFHLHLYHATSPVVIRHHSGRDLAELRRSGERYWGARCPDLTGADLVVDFDELLATWR